MYITLRARLPQVLPLTRIGSLSVLSLAFMENNHLWLAIKYLEFCHQQLIEADSVPRHMDKDHTHVGQGDGSEYYFNLKAKPFLLCWPV